MRRRLQRTPSDEDAVRCTALEVRGRRFRKERDALTRNSNSYDRDRYCEPLPHYDFTLEFTRQGSGSDTAKDGTGACARCINMHALISFVAEVPASLAIASPFRLRKLEGQLQIRHVHIDCAAIPQ